MRIEFFLLLAALNVSITANAAISSKCMKPFGQLLSERENSRFGETKTPIPVECQYYKVSDLDTESILKLKAVYSRAQHPFSLDAKLSEAFGVMKLGEASKETPAVVDSEYPFRNDRCTCETGLSEYPCKHHGTYGYTEYLVSMDRCRFVEGTHFTYRCRTDGGDTGKRYSFDCESKKKLK